MVFALTNFFCTFSTYAIVSNGSDEVLFHDESNFQFLFSFFVKQPMFHGVLYEGLQNHWRNIHRFGIGNVFATNRVIEFIAKTKFFQI